MKNKAYKLALSAFSSITHNNPSMTAVAEYGRMFLAEQGALLLISAW
jgi:hypothetical protein